jgi:hypothetical protein
VLQENVPLKWAPVIEDMLHKVNDEESDDFTDLRQ